MAHITALTNNIC